MKKQLCSLALTLVMLFSMIPTFTMTAAAATDPPDLWVAPSETNGIPARIDVFQAETDDTNGETSYTYQVYLPGNANTRACFLSWDGKIKATVDGKDYESGKCPIPPLNTEKSYTFSNGASISMISFQGSPGVHPIFIDIDETFKEPGETEPHTIEAMDDDMVHEKYCAGRININGTWYDMPKIKGRGNYTWLPSKDKRAYNFKLDKKITIPGIDNQKTKKWTILSEIGDHSLLRNRIGFQLACKMGIGQDAVSADVWMNGEYQGCYTLTPKYDSYVTKNGFFVEEDNYEEQSVADGGDPQFALDGLYGYGDTDYNYITVKKMGDNLLLHNGAVDESPENLEKAAARIQSWLQDAWDAIRADGINIDFGYGEGYNAKGRYYTEYIDIESFAKMFLMQEYIKSYDVCAGSIFFHRDGQRESDKLIAGPVWDLDNALGTIQYHDKLGAVGDLRTGKGAFIEEISEFKTSLFHTLYTHDDFKKEVRLQYNRYRTAFDHMEGDLEDLVDEISASALMNHQKVEEIPHYNLHYFSEETTLESGEYEQTYLATTDSRTDWPVYVENLKIFIKTRSLWFRNKYADKP